MLAEEIYSAHRTLHPGVPLDAGLLLLADESHKLDVEQAAALYRGCTRSGLATFGDLLREPDLSRLRIKQRLKKPLRHALQNWKARHMRLPTKGETAALFKLAKNSEKAEALLADGSGSAPGSSLRDSITWSAATHGATILNLLSPPPGAPEAPSVELLRTAIGYGNHAMVRLLREQVTIDDLLIAEQRGLSAAGLPLIGAGQLLDALRDTARKPALLLTYATRHWAVSAVEALLQGYLLPHHTHLSIAIGRDRDGLVDLFLPGGAQPPCATPPLTFANVKAALDARRADFVLRLLRAGAPSHGGPNDHRIVDRLGDLWHGWLLAADIDVAERMREGRKLAVLNAQLPSGIRLRKSWHRGAALRLEPVQDTLWELYASGAEHAAHVHCSLLMVRSVCPWVGTDWCDGGDVDVHRLYPRAAFQARLRALLLVATRTRMRQPVDTIWVSLVGRHLAAHGQPPNLDAMARRATDEESMLAHEQKNGGDTWGNDTS